MIQFSSLNLQTIYKTSKKDFFETSDLLLQLIYGLAVLFLFGVNTSWNYNQCLNKFYKHFLI